MRFSVIIPSRNEGQWLLRTVQSVREQSGDRLREVVVVDDGSVDGSGEIVTAQGWRDVKVLRGLGEGPAIAKNKGAAVASGDGLVFVDAHSLVSEGWLEEFKDVLGERAGAVPTIVVTSEGVDDGPVLARTFKAGRPPYEVAHWPARKGEPIPLGYGIHAVRADAFMEIGGFCELLSPLGGEDTEIYMRLFSRGYEVGAAPAATVRTLRKEWNSRLAAMAMTDEALHDIVWVNHVRTAMLHWSAARLVDMWGTLREDWRSHPRLFRTMWEGCHTPRVMSVREEMRRKAVRGDGDFFDRFGA